MNIVFLKKVRLRSVSSSDLGSILTPKRSPKGSQIGSKMEPKWDRKTIKKITSVFDRLLDGVHWDSAPAKIRAGAVEGVRGRHKSLPLGIWIRIDWDLLLWARSTRPEAEQARCLGGFSIGIFLFKNLV